MDPIKWFYNKSAIYTYLIPCPTFQPTINTNNPTHESQAFLETELGFRVSRVLKVNGKFQKEGRKHWNSHKRYNQVLWEIGKPFRIHRISSLPSPWLFSRFLFSFLFLHKLPMTNSVFDFSQLRLLSYPGFLLPRGFWLPLSFGLLAFTWFQCLCLLILLLPLFL